MHLVAAAIANCKLVFNVVKNISNFIKYYQQSEEGYVATVEYQPNISWAGFEDTKIDDDAVFLGVHCNVRRAP